eukprot:2987690-Prymnesium_polylepis.1
MALLFAERPVPRPAHTRRRPGLAAVTNCLSSPLERVAQASVQSKGGCAAKIRWARLRAARAPGA